MVVLYCYFQLVEHSRKWTICKWNWTQCSIYSLPWSFRTNLMKQLNNILLFQQQSALVHKTAHIMIIVMVCSFSPPTWTKLKEFVHTKNHSNVKNSKLLSKKISWSFFQICIHLLVLEHFRWIQSWNSLFMLQFSF